MNNSIKNNDTKNIIKSNPLRLISAIIIGIAVEILLLWGILWITSYHLLGIFFESRPIEIIFFILTIIAISRYVLYRLVDESNKLKAKRAIFGLLSGISIFFITCSSFGPFSVLLLFLTTIAISGYVFYRLVDESNKLKAKGAIFGLLSGIFIFFITSSFGLFLEYKILYYTDNYFDYYFINYYFNRESILILSQIISAIIGGYIAYRIGKSNILSIVIAIFVAGLSFLIFLWIVRF